MSNPTHSIYLLRSPGTTPPPPRDKATNVLRAGPRRTNALLCTGRIRSADRPGHGAHSPPTSCTDRVTHHLWLGWVGTPIVPQLFVVHAVRVLHKRRLRPVPRGARAPNHGRERFALRAEECVPGVFRASWRDSEPCELNDRWHDIDKLNQRRGSACARMCHSSAISRPVPTPAGIATHIPHPTRHRRGDSQTGLARRQSLLAAESQN